MSNDRRAAEQAPITIPEAASLRDVATPQRASVVDVLVAGGFRGFTVQQMFPERAA